VQFGVSLSLGMEEWIWWDEENVYSRFAIGARQCFDERTAAKHETARGGRHQQTRLACNIGRAKTVAMKMEMKTEPSFPSPLPIDVARRGDQSRWMVGVFVVWRRAGATEIRNASHVISPASTCGNRGWRT